MQWQLLAILVLLAVAAYTCIQTVQQLSIQYTSKPAAHCSRRLLACYSSSSASAEPATSSLRSLQQLPWAARKNINRLSALAGQRGVDRE